MPKLRHIALHTANPEQTADFFKSVFEMEEVGRTDSLMAEGIYLSDGDMNLAVLRFKSPRAADRGDGLGPVMGLHHFGFWVEDADEIRGRLREAGAELLMTRDASATTSFFEEKWVAPDRVQFDITEHGWAGARPPEQTEDGAMGAPHP
ncbi:MAG: VOC family protein [Chloroflexi bacterium]|nr:VOC family protein [Chloroflexota bacterium]